jgi:hypothetical protein
VRSNNGVVTADPDTGAGRGSVDLQGAIPRHCFGGVPQFDDVSGLVYPPAATIVRHNRAMPSQPQLPPIPTITTLDGVVEAIDSVIGWSIGVSSRLGYFAALYKRITIAVRTGIAQGAFEDGPRMEQFDVAFANRYFDALNGYCHPGRFPKPTRSWRVTFDAATGPEPIIMQHMLAGVNTHIGLDLGISVQKFAPSSKLPTLHEDFNRINAVLASQVNGVIEDLNELSPALADVYAVLTQHEIFLVNQAVRTSRDSAWRFAAILAMEPAFARPITVWARDRTVAKQTELIYDPPGLVGLIDTMIKAIAARESRDIVKNIQALDMIASTPAPIRTTM